MNIYQNESEQTNEVNPWKTIWYAPRAAIRSVIDNKSLLFPIVLATLSGVSGGINQAIGDEIGYDLPFSVILLLAFFGGAISGILGWLIVAGVFTLTGKIFKGTAKFKEMALALGAAYIPYAIVFVLALSNLLFIGGKLFVDVELSIFETLWFLFTVFITIVLSLWSVFLTIKAIAEAHRFSSWKGLFTFLILVAVLFVIFLVLFLIILVIALIFI